jgi:hypothetical protein
MAWHARAFVHSQLAEQREAINCYRQALASVGERKNPMARGVLVIMLAEFGDACRAGGRAVQVLNDLGWPDLLGGGAVLEQADLPSPQR